MSEPSRYLVFAAGGTAGHIEPALAVARAWKTKHPQDRSLFLGTALGLENTLVPAAEFTLATVAKVVMPRRFDMDLVKFPVRLFRAVITARSLIKDSDLLIGFGGYISATAYLAARLGGVPIVVHEANAKVGWANRLGALLTKYVAVAQPVSSRALSRAVVTGMPLRADVRQAYVEASQDWQKARRLAKEKLGWSAEHPSLLVLGGSQGSSFINSQINRALPVLHGRGIQVLHSVGVGNALPPSYTGYRAVPYIEDMATAYLAADVVLARSGAVTCAEFAALGRMAIFVPLPIGNGEQARNADQLVSVGRAIVLPQKDFSSQWLEEHLEEMVEQSRKQQDVSINLDLDAEQKIVSLMEDALRKRSR